MTYFCIIGISVHMKVVYQLYVTKLGTSVIDTENPLLINSSAYVIFSSSYDAFINLYNNSLATEHVIRICEQRLAVLLPQELVPL